MVDLEWNRKTIFEKLDWLKDALEDVIAKANHNASVHQEHLRDVIVRLAALEEPSDAFQEIPVNRRPVSQAALAWLLQVAKAEAAMPLEERMGVDPQTWYVPQLGAWGLLSQEVRWADNPPVDVPDRDQLESHVLAMLEPGNCQALQNLRWLLVQNEAYAEAEEDLEEALRLAPNPRGAAKEILEVLANRLIQRNLATRPSD
jgi:hypothetical protein